MQGTSDNFCRRRCLTEASEPRKFLSPSMRCSACYGELPSAARSLTWLPESEADGRPAVPERTSGFPGAPPCPESFWTGRSPHTPAWASIAEPQLNDPYTYMSPKW